MPVKQDLNCSRKSRRTCTEGKSAGGNDLRCTGTKKCANFCYAGWRLVESRAECGKREILTVFSLDTLVMCADNCVRIERCLVWPQPILLQTVPRQHFRRAARSKTVVAGERITKNLTFATTHRFAIQPISPDPQRQRARADVENKSLLNDSARRRIL